MISERIAQIIAHFCNGNKSLFANRIGVTPSVIGNITGERGGNPSFEVTQKIINAFESINPDWLIIGKGEMLRKEVESVNDINTFCVSDFKQKGYAPYYSDLLVGAGRYDLLSGSGIENPESWVKFPGVDADGWFPVIGCSMEPKISAGDVIAVKTIDRWECIDPDKTYLIITRDDRMIKHLEVDENNTDVLWATSENYRRFKLFKSEIIHIFKVVWAGRFV